MPDNEDYTTICEFLLMPGDFRDDAGLLLVMNDQMVEQIIAFKGNAELLTDNIRKASERGFDQVHNIYQLHDPINTTPRIEVFSHFLNPGDYGWIYILAMGRPYADMAIQMTQIDEENSVVMMQDLRM